MFLLSSLSAEVCLNRRGSMSMPQQLVATSLIVHVCCRVRVVEQSFYFCSLFHLIEGRRYGRKYKRMKERPEQNENVLEFITSSSYILFFFSLFPSHARLSHSFKVLVLFSVIVLKRQFSLILPFDSTQVQ